MHFYWLSNEMQVETKEVFGALSVIVSFLCNHARINYSRNLYTGMSLYVANIKHTGQMSGFIFDYFTQTLLKVISAREQGRTRNITNISNSFAEDPMFLFMRKESKILGIY